MPNQRYNLRGTNPPRLNPLSMQLYLYIIHIASRTLVIMKRLVISTYDWLSTLPRYPKNSLFQHGLYWGLGEALLLLSIPLSLTISGGCLLLDLLDCNHKMLARIALVTGLLHFLLISFSGSFKSSKVTQSRALRFLPIYAVVFMMYFVRNGFYPRKVNLP